MIVALPYESGEIIRDIENAERFMIYELEGNLIQKEDLAKTHCEGITAITNFLKNRKVDVVLCNTASVSAQSELRNAGIDFELGISGDTDEAISSFISQKQQKLCS